MNAVKDNPNDTCDTHALNTLLLGELSAVETYDEALSQFENHETLAELERIRENHAQAVVQLRERVVRFGGTRIGSPEPWSAFEAAVKGGTSNTLGLAALKQGEQHELNEYELALKNEDVNPECKDLIRTQLLPNSKDHIDRLNRLMGGM